MRNSLVIAGLLAGVMALPALAQSNPPAATKPATPPAATTQAPSATPPATMATTTSQSSGQMWRTSKLDGLDVYNDKNEKLGDIKEILIDKSGKVAGVVIGVGGFLGMGEHDIMVEMSKLKFVDQPVRTSSTTSTTTGSNTRPATTTTTTTANDHKWYPDHAVFSGATKESLKSMPQFKF
jgi:sporulation protein YlmC with PRC-barrel domain